jgi:hypothetical protein
LTTTPTDRQPRPQPTDRTLQLAAQLLRRDRLKPRRSRGVTADQMAAALARVLMVTSPGSDHGRLLNSALTPRPKQAKTQGPRPPAEKAVRALLRLGQSPTPAAVAGVVDDLQRQQTARAARTARAAGHVQADGPRAVQAIAAHWQEHGCGPTWRGLAREMGWPEQDAAATVGALERAGLVETGDTPRSLRPTRGAAAGLIVGGRG